MTILVPNLLVEASPQGEGKEPGGTISLGSRMTLRPIPLAYYVPMHNLRWVTSEDVLQPNHCSPSLTTIQVCGTIVHGHQRCGQASSSKSLHMLP